VDFVSFKRESDTTSERRLQKKGEGEKKAGGGVKGKEKVILRLYFADPDKLEVEVVATTLPGQSRSQLIATTTKNMHGFVHLKAQRVLYHKIKAK